MGSGQRDKTQPWAARRSFSSDWEGSSWEFTRPRPRDASGWVVMGRLSFCFTKSCWRKPESGGHLAGLTHWTQQAGRLSEGISITTQFVVVIKREEHQELKPAIAFDPDTTRAVKRGRMQGRDAYSRGESLWVHSLSLYMRVEMTTRTYTW